MGNGTIRRDIEEMNDVKWYLVSDEDEEIIAERDDILDIIEMREHINKETRITDKEEENYDRRNQSETGAAWGRVSSD